jgi:hypothetical protein
VIGLPSFQALDRAQGAQIWALIQGLGRFSHKNARTFDNWFDESFPSLRVERGAGAPAQERPRRSRERVHRPSLQKVHVSISSAEIAGWP